MKHIAILGCGAVGALYGLRLHNLLGKEHVCFLVDEERKKRYTQEGIYLNDQIAPFQYCTSKEAPVADLIILATKNHHLTDAISMLQPVVGPETAILSLLNGIESERELSKAFGKEKVLYSFAVGLNSTHIGNRITYTKEGRIVFGEKNNEKTERVKEISALFDRAGISYLVPENIERELWNKFMLNTAYNTLSGLLSATYGDLDQDPVWNLAQKVCKEVQSVAKAEGVLLPASLIEENHRIVTSLGFAGKTSMCQDMDAGRKTENQWFSGTVIKLGKVHGIPTPTCEVLSALVEARENISLRLGQVQ
ncbi:ketopantoate reductase family protein [Sphaerochaeta halotolerans]|jgi:2-dehydropantoate 2-reductase|uniref:2-dehydropantoate 2-reductase n=1 Tax=Sphaerochaeta halotolerans TaxID=2293840 RepID=A0A372MIK2_9SPIR|nr:ketopantoate reductase family protein [Sphaerochaeta halotolerans]MBG0767739.1 ketopantoate reductase family protein [Spirochaetaceae bacterium]MXI86026.1 2-dehydropantoate 2-reductase [Sphaerochaeta halotolerans]RFU95627.1 ketopantoate reductase family protein [Sphaerochaeta halotolerans]